MEKGSGRIGPETEREGMKRSGASIIFTNSSREVLLFLRDDKPEIPFPNMWDLPGGHVEEAETPEACIVREMLEEIETDVTGCTFIRMYDFPDRFEYIFTMPLDRGATDIPLHEGQMLRWFPEAEIRMLELAFGFDLVLEDFFAALRMGGDR